MPFAKTSASFDPPPTAPRSPSRGLRFSRAASVALAVLCLAAAAGVLGTAAQALASRNATVLPAEFHLPLWPSTLDGRPSIALIACSGVIILAAVVSLIAGRLGPTSNTHPFLIVAAPLAGLAAALIATAVAYAVESSNTTDSLRSWSCRWSQLSMLQPPYFGSLCHQSQAALYLSVLLIPVELFAIAAAVTQIAIRRTASEAQPNKSSFS